MRFFISLLTATLLLTGANHSQAIEKGTEKPQQADLKPGDYVWDAKAADKGAVDIIVSLGEQKLSVYRDGVLIGRSTISSGSKGRETPKGVYMIVEKNVSHHSNKYHEASMPYMERLTWDGLAIHAGNTPGHPESHGCMHVPLDFAKKLYAVTQEGDSVLVADGSNDKPAPTAGPNLLFPGTPAASPAPAPGGSPAPGATPPPFVWKPEEVPNGPLLIVCNTADKNVRVLRKGVEIGKAELGGPQAGASVGNHVYVATAQPAKNGRPQWSALGNGDGSPVPDFRRLSKGWTILPEFRDKVRDVIAPGTTLVITDQAATSGKPGGAKAED